MKFLGYANWFISIIISQMKDRYISVDKARYDTSIVAKYLDTITVNISTKFHEIILPYDMIFTKVDASTSDEFEEHPDCRCSLWYCPTEEKFTHSRNQGS